MKKIVYSLVIVCILAGAAYAAASTASAPLGEDGFGLRQSVLRTILELNLTDAQKHEAALILKKHRPEAGAAFDRVRLAVADLGEVMKREPQNEEAVREAFRKAAAAGEDMAVARGRIMAELRGVLTPGQQKLLFERRDVLGGKIRDRIEAGRALLGEWIELRAGE